MKKALLSLLLLTSCCTPRTNLNDILEPVYQASKIEYASDPEGISNGDYWQLPETTRRIKQGDCEDMAFVLEEEFNKSGVSNRVVFGYVIYGGQMHAWNEVYQGKDRFIVDGTRGMIVNRTNINPNLYVETIGPFDEKLKKYRERQKKGEL
jgi:predicted transglutaminase-like cysteine proteinase